MAWVGKTPGFYLKAVGAATAFSHQQHLSPSIRPAPYLDQPNPRRFQPLSALNDIDDDLLPFAEAREPRSLKSGDVNEHVPSATIAGNETEALLGIEPFHCAGLLGGYARK